MRKSIHISANLIMTHKGTIYGHLSVNLFVTFPSGTKKLNRGIAAKILLPTCVQSIYCITTVAVSKSN